MLDGMPLIDAHQHPVRLSTVKPAWMDWAERFELDVWYVEHQSAALDARSTR